MNIEVFKRKLQIASIYFASKNKMDGWTDEKICEETNVIKC